MIVDEIVAQLEKFSTKDLEKLEHQIRAILYARDERHAASFFTARDKQREIERKMAVEPCVDEMICQRCGHELDCFCGCRCSCHELV